MKARTETTGNVVEIFSGIQGEGLFLGCRHIFLRLAGCNLRCDYCDQPEARKAPNNALAELHPGSRDFIPLKNPVFAWVAARAVAILDETPGLHSFLAVTGGEPLMQPEFLAALLPRIRRTGLNVLLETNGTRYRELDALRDLVDVVSMDFKLCSATGRPMPAAAHERFLATAVRRRRSVVYVKAVVSSVTTAAEIRQCAATIARVQESVPLILQPVTPQRPDRAQPPTPDALLTLQAVALELLPDVRVIPQTHKTIGQR